MEGFNRDLIRRVAGTREGTSIMMAMMTEFYPHISGDSNTQSLEDLIDTHFTGISTTEDKVENKTLSLNSTEVREAGLHLEFLCDSINDIYRGSDHKDRALSNIRTRSNTSLHCL